MKMRLQGIGMCEAVEASNLKIGDVVIWNYGYKSQVVDIIPSKTGKTATFKMLSLTSGEVHDRKMSMTRPVVIDTDAA